MTHYTEKEHDQFVFRLATSTQKQQMEAIWRVAQITREANRGRLSRKAMIEHIEDVLVAFPDTPRFEDDKPKEAATTS